MARSNNAQGGYGHITAKGYRRVWDKRERRLRMEHVLVWESKNGPVPNKMVVHHRDFDKLNNDIENLELVDALTHKRIHSGCELRDGEWWKPCGTCGEFKRASTDYYRRKDGIGYECKKCSIGRAIADKRKRRA